MDTQELNQTLIEDIWALTDYPLSVDYLFFAIEAIIAVVLFTALILLFINSKRPGTIMMLFGYTFSLIGNLLMSAGLFVDVDLVQNGLTASIIYYLPLGVSMFTLVACCGLLMFAMSFKSQYDERASSTNEP